ncbi:MAG: uroporphyrinogen decarboxylase family protein [Rectinemataceae bacterium]
MTSRERVLAALAHGTVDRVPVDFGGHRSSGIMAIGYARLRRALGLPSRPIRVYDVVQQLAVVDTDLLDRFGVDTVELGRGFSLGDADWKEWVLPDGTPCLVPAWVDLRQEGGDWWLYNADGRRAGVQKKGSLYFEQVYWPYSEGIPEDLSSLADAIGSVQWSTATPPQLGRVGLTGLAAGARDFRASTDRAIIFLFGGSFYELSQYLCGTENFMVLMGTEPEAVNRLLDALLESHLGSLRTYLGAFGKHVDIVLFGDDFGMQTGLQMSPDMYREYFKERERRLWGEAKRLAPVRTQLHCCGGVRAILGDFIDVGLDSINPVQTNCAGMEVAGLKRDFGTGITLWGGGCDTQSVLSRGTAAEVRDHVLERLPLLMAGSGFVFQQIHNIMANVAPENIIAMFDAVAEHNKRMVKS